VDPPALTAVNLAEVIDVLGRTYGHLIETVAERIDWLIAGGLDVLEADYLMAREAGRIRAQRYHRRQAPISLGDAFAAAGAFLLEARLATSDPALAAVARAEGVEVITLPDSSGRRP
jgi:predicted nucleic acid-binding protein